jgi:integrase/recombinase XerC
MTSASSAIPQYLDAIKLSRSPNTLRTYRHALRIFVSIVGPDAELSEENFITFLQTTARRNERAQVTYRIPVSRLYKRYAPGVPVDLLVEDYGQKRHKGFIQYNEKDVDKIIEYASTLRGDLLALRDRAWILTAADTGLRLFEVSKLNRGDIDFDRARALIIGKGDKPGVIRFSPRSLGAIRDYLSTRAELDGKSGKPLSSLPLFARHDPGAGKKVKRIGTKGLSATFDLRKREAGITEEDESERGEVTAHKLRHRFVTLILRAKRNPAIAQALARHEDINTTMRYGHLAESELDNTYKEIFGE